MKVKIDYASLFCTAVIMLMIHLVNLLIWLSFIRYPYPAFICGVLSYVLSFITGYCIYKEQKDGNWLIDHRVTSIEKCGRRLLLNGSYKTKWLRRYAYTDACTCANFMTQTIWLQPAMNGYISVIVPDGGK